MQKYERGATRVVASRLVEIARVLDVPIGFFYDDIDPVKAPASAGFTESAATMSGDDLLTQPETIELIAAYYEIAETRLRQCLFELAKALSESGSDRTAGAAALAAGAGAGSRRNRRGPRT